MFLGLSQVRAVAACRVGMPGVVPAAVQSRGEIVQRNSLFHEGVKDTSLRSAVCSLCLQFHRFFRPGATILLPRAPV